MNNDKLNALITKLNSSQEQANAQMFELIGAIRQQSAADFLCLTQNVDTILQGLETNLQSLIAYYATKRRTLLEDALERIEEISLMTLDNPQVGVFKTGSSEQPTTTNKN